nr:PREDICTED: fibroblast growth factor-binding protein 3 [Equus przewalskii]
MSALRLRASLSLLLLLGGCVLSAVRRDKGRAGSAAELALGPAGPSSGRFVSPERHACSWQLLLPGPRPAAGSELALRCQGPAGTRLHCAYPPAGPTAGSFPRDLKPGAGSQGRPQEPAPGPPAGARPPPSAPPKEKPSEKKTKDGKRKAASDPEEERPLGTGPDPDGLDENAKLTETYCAEEWRSVCNFFVSFWNG